MLTIFALVAAVVVFAAALKRLNQNTTLAADASPVTKAARSAPDWRLARSEGPTLSQAVEVMEGYNEVLSQLGDAWLVSANQKVRESGMFRANVLQARSLKTLIDDDCAALVNELRDLEHKRDCVGVFDLRREQADALADWAGVLNVALRERLMTLSAERGMEMSDLVNSAAKQGGKLEDTTVDQWLPRLSEGADLRLKEVVS